MEGCKGYREREEQAASQSLTDHWRCQSQHPSGCSVAVGTLGLGPRSGLGGVATYVVDLILGREGATELDGFYLLLLDLGEAHCHPVRAVDFHIFHLSFAQTSACVDWVSSPPLQGCRDTDRCEEKLFRDCVSVAGIHYVIHIPGEFACIPCSVGFVPASF